MGCASSSSNNTKNKRESTLHYSNRDSTFEETNKLNKLSTDNENHNDDEVMRPSVSKKEMRKEQERIRDAEINNAIEQAADEAAKKAERDEEDKKEKVEEKKSKTMLGLFNTKKEEDVKNNDEDTLKEDEKRGPIAPTRCVGYLLKQGGTIKTWKKRFFILDKGVLIYFTSETTPGSNEGFDEKGRIALSGNDKIKIIDEKKGKLMLSSTVRELPMIVDNLDLASAWRDAIQKHIDYVLEKEKMDEKS